MIADEAQRPDVPPPAGQARTWLVRYPRLLPAALFLAIAAITAFSVYNIEASARQQERAEVREYAQSIASSMERRGNSFSAYLRAGAALFASIDVVERTTFEQFVSELRIDQSYRGADGIGWVQLSQNASTRVAAQNNRLASEDSLRPAVEGVREVIAPVTYMAPGTAANMRAIGFDMYSESTRSEAMHEAQRTVQPTASGRILLSQQGGGDAPGFAIFMPVYRPVPGSPSLERELSGFVFTSFEAGAFLDAAIERAPPTDLGVRLYDGLADTAHLLVSRSLHSAGNDRFEQSVIIANRELLLVIESSSAATLAPLSMVTLVFGLALASLLMLVARLMTRQAMADEARLAFFEEQHSIRNSLSRELNHRVKNTLANVLSILSLTRRRASGLDDFADSLEGRIRALSATHDLLTETEWGTTALRSVIEAELMHFGVVGDGAVTLEGPDVELAPNDALSFGLAVHELATNAAKYGALSTPQGKVAVRWSMITPAIAEVEWVESGGPPVPQARPRGFGTDLIEKIVAHELRHRVLLEFPEEGVRCVLGVPVRRRGEFHIRERS